MGVKGTKNLTESEFDNIKLMQQAKLRPGQVKKITGRSANTVQYIFMAKDFSDYRIEQQKRNQAKKNPRSITKGSAETVSFPVASPSVSHEDIQLIITKLDELRDDMGELLDRKKSADRANGFRFGKRSR